MPLIDLIPGDAILPSLRAASKKTVLQEMSERAAAVSGLSDREVFDAVLQRERLGSTGVGNGVAIPHGKLARCERIFGVFARLEKPIDFEAMDGAPVDLVFLLIASEMAGADHLKALARVARFLRDPKLTMQLRMTRDAKALHAVLMQSDHTSHAA
ncbi:PTS sugar transporter subunit IIA [Lichenifustis flavocetrariae]|uniref:PTS sugar transporter subunit IIA n=1 Tax=Lichenifustis flavocetrariae TaxID=2949735 RepID=A0AA41YV58_9HYPH|nr:PTS sugar transporter subunit IIA [Lichenifustis flavocetrariae]MCW6507905.1 PTS sugar transporter subunit IIA [Lichenifustis flavocetrariae]